MTCPLCKLEIQTKQYYTDEKIVILDCMTCNIPMLVFKRHGAEAPLEWKLYAEKKVKGIFGNQIYFRTRAKQVKNHEHWHIYNVR